MEQQVDMPPEKGKNHITVEETRMESRQARVMHVGPRALVLDFYQFCSHGKVGYVWRYFGLSQLQGCCLFGHFFQHKSC